MKTQKSAFPEIAKVLGNLGSHDIYDVKYVAKKLREAGYLDEFTKGYSRAEMWAQIENRGLGGQLEYERGVRYIGGYQASNVVVSMLGLHPISKMGRGSQHWANIDAIQKEV